MKDVAETNTTARDAKPTKGKYKTMKPAKPMSEWLLARAIRIFNETDFWFNSKGCKLWPKSTNTNGYGKIVLKDENKLSRSVIVHRLAWKLVNGEIKDGLWVLHKCDERRCCNPEHLFLGTEEDNWNDMYAKKRNVRGEKHPHAKLTEDDVAEAKAMMLAGATIAETARKYGVARTTMEHIKHGRNWIHVKPKETA